MILLLFIFSLDVSAADWWKETRVELPDSYIYTGFSEGDLPADELKERAFLQISSLIVREHMGFRLDADESVIESQDQAQYQFVTRLRSEPIVLKGLTLMDLREEKSPRGLRVYIRVKISKKEIQEIIHRSYDDRVDHVYGEVNLKNSSLVVKTEPSGAFIELTHLETRFQVYGHGNAKFHLPEGKYEMIVRYPGYERVQKKIEVKGDKGMQTLQLKPLYGALVIETTPRSAKVESLFQVKGSNPFELIPHKIYKFRVTHPDYFPQEFEVSLPDERRMDYAVTLSPRPSQVRFQVEPAGATFYFEDKETSHKEVLNLQRGQYSLRFTAKGYDAYEATLDVEPNKIYPTKHVKLKPEPEHKWRFEYLPVEKREGRAQFTILPFNLYREWDYFALGGGIAAAEDRLRYGNQEVMASATDLHLGARVLLPKIWNIRVYAMASVGSYVFETQGYRQDKKNGFRYENTYTATGFGARYYFNHRISLQGEWQLQRLQDSVTKATRSERRFQIGVGFDF